MTAALLLRPDEARLACLAVACHLGRPGAETDADTLRPRADGLAPLPGLLEPRLGAAAGFAVELSAGQLERLGAAAQATVNELKQYGMAGGRSAIPGFAEAFARLYPEAAAGGGAGALDLVPDAVLLRRRLAAAAREAAAAEEGARESPAAEAPRRGRGWRGRLRALVRRARRS